MARVKSLDQITGNLKNLSFYTRKGSDDIFVRSKGGPTKSQIKRLPAFEGVRKANMEFGACSTMSKQIRQAFSKHSHVADFNMAPTLCSLAKTIQKEDAENPVGERSIKLSKYKQMLRGFDFNRITRFDSMLRIALQGTIERQQLTAQVNIPAFACSYALYNPGEHALFRIVAVLGVVIDMQINSNKTAYEDLHDSTGVLYDSATTTWYSTQTSVAEQSLVLQIAPANYIGDCPKQDGLQVSDADTLILSVMLEFGRLDAFGNPTPIKKVGAGKVLMVR